MKTIRVARWTVALVLTMAAAVDVQPQQRADAQPAAVTKTDVQRWMKELSNWGRWGPNDQLGALNLITPEKRKRAMALVKTGQVVSCRVRRRSRPAPGARA